MSKKEFPVIDQTTGQKKIYFMKTLRVRSGSFLPDEKQWTKRFVVQGDSGNIYTISQHKEKRYWACSCRGWTTQRKCKHLSSLGLPSHEKPLEVRFEAFVDVERYDYVDGVIKNTPSLKQPKEQVRSYNTENLTSLGKRKIAL